ncbi:PREDICTED: laminin subunit alpha-like [Priapulus caudatus]|uniref:Laminin subunit alpha-like n=1 Tax=Priapulus caudatus TaxID=37621 RepID=A0ABM1EMJ1_PRICU|nr:PREDICTED: laminin subunit alpha-like [Priapulus caudatus]
MAGYGCTMPVLWTLLVFLAVNTVRSEVLTPPYFNLAEGRRIESTSTCGEGVQEKELYCRLTGANTEEVGERPDNILQGQLCDYCDPRDANRKHPITQATDGTQKWWQSPPLSRGAEFNEVNITIDLGQEFHVAYVFMKMGNAPRPGVWVLERSKDNGVSWDPWQYFADSPGDCLHFFNLASNEPITEDDSVICTTEFSKVIPLEGGEIVISLVNNRPNAMNFSHSKELQEFTEATNVRLRLLRSKTLLGHLLAVARQDPTVTRRYFYSIKDISIGGRCVCNGHANVCDKTDPRDPYKLLCRCQHNTCGAQCDTCCTDYVQKKWRRATEEDSYVCEACNCHGHSEQCEYDADVDTKSMSLDISGQYIGGGVCQNCRDYTEGINCEKCISGFYRPEGRLRNETDACTRCRCDPRVSTGACSDVTGQCECRDNFAGVNCDECAYGYYAPPHCYPCDCYANGTIDAVCYPEQGQCPCRYNYGGATCDRCAQGFFDFPHCTPCNCSQYGSLDEICDEVSGQCKCSGVFTDRACDRCREGTWNYPHCEYCQCDLAGVTPEICNDETGRCLCLDGFNSANCGRCAAGFYGFPDCQECTCDPVGSEGDACAVTGQCRCKPNFSGPKCGLCASGFYSYPDCLPCDCDLLGAHGASCNDQGQCICRGNFEGLHCDRCRENFYNYPLCEACNCHPAGVSDSFGGCDTVAEGQLCECKERVTGRICDECKSLFWNLQHNNREGCQDCDCWEPGTLSGYSSCDGETGQCLCKPYVTSRRCDQCQPGTYKLLENNLFGCESCMCDAGGALNAHCDTVTGQCLCRPRVSGRACDYPHTNHFFPTLFQHQFEIEDGRTPSGSLVRFAYHDDVFPGYSWRGYAIFSQTQPDVLMDIEVDKPSLYLIVYHYVNRGSKTINGQVIVTSEYDDETTTVQKGTLELLPSTQPSFTSVKVGGTDYPFVLDPGRWTVTTSIPDLVDAVFLDYFVLLPQVYYEATLLQEHIYAPCSLDAAAGATCLHYVYPPLAQYPRARGETGYVGVNNERMRVQQLEDEHVLTALDSPSMAWLSNNQTSMFLDLVTDAPGEYLLLINYYMTERGRMDTLAVDVATPSGPQQGKALLYDCNYRSLCRSVVLDLEGRAAVYAVDTDYISLTLQGSIDIDAAIDSVVAIPIKDWTEMLYTPQVRCLRKDGECEESSFPLLPSAVRYEVEAGVNADRRVPDIEMIADVYDKDIGLVYMSENEGALEVQGTVSRPGTYSFVSHHYQPKHSEFSLDVIVDNGYHVYEAVLPVPYCGSLSGCRSLVETGSRDFQFEVQENFTLSFQVAGRKSLWMDYVLVIPSTDQRPDFNAKGMVDKASDFIQECAKDHFYVDPSRQGFCRDAVFSLTTEYNNGALQCGCNIDGSLSFQCEEFGGRCICKDNVIGRICSQCHPGYYGFPNCQKCNCPNGICEQDTGKCICPPNVAGPQCNVCLPETFGYDPFIGCEECACEYYGVEDRNMTCDLITGKCRCKENVVGRQCTDCMVGSYAYPHCVDCTCSRYGVTRDVCDQTNGDCICKDNVEGARCDQCAPGSYYLHPDNEKGCTSCFCFGVTKACASSELVVVYIMDMRDWNVTNLENPLIDDASNLAYNDPTLINVRVRESRPIDPDAASYFVAPAPYLGDKVTSYGGRLTYSVAHTPADQDAYRIIQGDVIITGNNISVVHTSMDQPEPELSTHISVALVESSFVLADDAAHQVAVTREQFMMVLADVTSLHIRATYYSATQDSMIANVSLPIGIVGGAETEGHDLDQAHSVEQCQCPRNYEGSSCEVCAEGYHRVDEGPYLGHCVPCNCYGHAETCDRNTGECVDCRNNTVGANCDRCELGYYGDATQGSEWDCQICACPLPTVANNFAASCTPLEDGFEVTCVCLEGYKGVNCEMCAAGYWGDPTEPGGACVRCECNDNLDLSTPEPCDTATGECLSCGNDTGGPACSRCVPGYYGDAIIAKNCVRCSCDACGTEECDFDTGSCRCAAGVEGVACDRCQRNMYGFSSCEGCTHCNCSEASMSSQCDAETGDCECQPGVRGRTCDTCKNGYWNFSPFGCQKCDCENFVDTGTICDQATGQCKCLPGVTGDKCDTCDEKWVFIENVGCQPCDVCTHILIDDVAWLETNVSGVMDELANVSIGVYAYARLRRDQDRVDALRPLVGGIVTDPSQVNLRPLQQDMNGLEQYANHVRDTADGTVAESTNVNEKVMVVKEERVAVEMMMRETVGRGQQVVDHASSVWSVIRFCSL